MNSTETLIAVVDATVRFSSGRHATTALDGVTLELRAGESVAIVGPSGAGKTTLLELLVGWRTPAEGRVERSASLPADWSGISVVPQSIGLLDELTIGQNIDLPGRLGFPVRESGPELARALGIGELWDRLPEEVSLGEQQRAAIARALLAAPRVLIADEPTSHQDKQNVERISAALDSASRTGTTTVVTTHDDRLLDRVSRIVYLRSGRVERQREGTST